MFWKKNKKNDNKNKNNSKKRIIENSNRIAIVQLPRTPLPPDVKEKVLYYLVNSHFVAVRSYLESPMNVFTGKPIPEVTGNYMTDGKWIWYDDYMIYVRDYDIELPQEFVDDVIAFFNNGGETATLQDPRILCLMQREITENQLLVKRAEWNELGEDGEDVKQMRKEYFSELRKAVFEKYPNEVYTDITKPMINGLKTEPVEPLPPLDIETVIQEEKNKPREVIWCL